MFNTNNNTHNSYFSSAFHLRDLSSLAASQWLAASGLTRRLMASTSGLLSSSREGRVQLKGAATSAYVEFSLPWHKFFLAPSEGLSLCRTAASSHAPQIVTILGQGRKVVLGSGVEEHMPFLWLLRKGQRAWDGWLEREGQRESLLLLCKPTLSPSCSRSRRPGPALWAAATTTIWTRSAQSWCKVRRTECSYLVSCTEMVFTFLTHLLNPF